MMQRPVLVEDIALTFTAMGRLPGTFIKWFLEELELEGLCKLADRLEHRGARAEILYGLHDGKTIHYFYAAMDGTMDGTIAPTPRGDYGFGWNAIFIPKGHTKTYAEYDDDEVRGVSHRARAIDKLRVFLQSAG
jgi:inosine triphosphate pyrophosphatase